MLKIGITLFLLMAGLLFAASDKTPQNSAQCIESCKKKCAASLDSCKKAAKKDADLQSCQKSYNLCASNCVNKACK